MSEPDRTSQNEENAADERTGGSSATSTTRRFGIAPAVIAYCFNLIIQPLIAVAGILGLIYLFGVAQSAGYFVSADRDSGTAVEVADNTEYVCPMLCVAPSTEPGRCPVCGMELKARKPSGDAKDTFGLTIAPASRRLSNIQTVVAIPHPMERTITAPGRVGYDETSEASISAYVSGRLEQLHVDFVGAEVTQGDPLAVIYSPDLYSAQVELLSSKEALETEGVSDRLAETNRRLYQTARRRLVELGLTPTMIDAIETSGTAGNRITISAPVSGTVVEKLADEGSYVETGAAIFRLVDLSSVWLRVEVFPQDAGALSIGQSVSVTMQSQPGRRFEGRVAFVDPQLDPRTGTVPVRVVIPNDASLIRIGDLAQAAITIDETVEDAGYVVVPRDAVLTSGDESVAYVETESGRFEFRSIETGAAADGMITVIEGLEPGESVVMNAAFMLDSAFNMAGKPSLVDPERALRRDEAMLARELEEQVAIERALAELTPDDRESAAAQIICPVAGMKLGSMGAPVKVEVADRIVWICCEGCRTALLESPGDYFSVLDSNRSESVLADLEPELARALEPLSEEDLRLVLSQRMCPVADFRLGGMGTPVKVDVDGQPVFICCEACRSRLLNEPAKYLAKVAGYRENAEGDE